MMKRYPFRIDSEKFMSFKDNNNKVVSLVVKEDEFKSLEELRKYLVDYNIKYKHIKENYIRYYTSLPKKSDSSYITKDNEGYTFCKKGRGAKKVYVIERG